MAQRQFDERHEHPAELRARAGRARKHARALRGDPAGPRLDKFADELDATAEAMEAAEVTAECGHSE